MKQSAFVLMLLLCAILAGCSWLDRKKQPLPGVRISVLGLYSRLEPDPKLAATPIALPPPVVNADWPQAGGDPDHAMHRLALPASLRKIWSASVGRGSSDYLHVTAPPIVAGGRVYAMDGGANLSAFDAATGRRLWQVSLRGKKEGEAAFGGVPFWQKMTGLLTGSSAAGAAFGGGVAFWHGRLYAATGYGDVLALDPGSGKILWRHPAGAPVHAPPTVSQGRVYVVTVDNELSVLSAEDGRKLWTHNGVPETAGLLGGASPAAAGEVVVVPYSSGELYALTAATGRPLWSDNLAAARGEDAVSSLADIRGRPVIDGERVFAIGHSGRMVAIDMRTGNRVWEQEIGGSESPWPAGGYVYVLTNDGELVCLARDTGKVRWLRQLRQYENQKDREDPIYWVGPVLGGNRLIVLSSNGRMESVSPYDGKPLGEQRVAGRIYIAPVIAGNTLYILNDDATLAAYR